jgi:hypothetical protein
MYKAIVPNLMIQSEITVPSVPSDQSLSIPVITRLIVSMYSIKIVYIEEIVKLSQGHLGQAITFVRTCSPLMSTRIVK